MKKFMQAQTGYGWLFAGGIMLAYLLTMFVFSDMLPAQWSFDSTYLQDLITQGTDMESDAYVATANLFALLPDSMLMGFISLLGCGVIAWMAGSAFTLSSGAAAGVMLTPLLLMGLLRPQKEVIVVLLSVVLMLAVVRARRALVPLVAVAALYLPYGAFVRPYYLLIFLVLLALHFVPRWSKGTIILAIAAGLASLFLLPGDVYLALQGPRDNGNFYRVLGDVGNRTFFLNPYYPDNLFAFMANYAYAALRLNLPLLFSVAPQEVFLVLSATLYFWLGRCMFKLGNWRAQFLARLFVAHILVLTLFEPDLGSYLRHASSVALYLWPGLLLWQRMQVSLPARHPMLTFLRLDHFQKEPA
ncbi:MAG TPA: hypothetical protein VHP58_02525 [Alphaproteobacteria bacterium]|nr:hypothetical protein [Alphaproteobacteria bacterium]